MEVFYFQLLSVVFGTLITGCISWMAINTWRLTNKISAFDINVKVIIDDINSMAADIKELRKYDAMLATHAVQLGGMDRRIIDLEHHRKKGNR